MGDAKIRPMRGTPRERLERYLVDHGIDLDSNSASEALDVIMQWAIAEAREEDVVKLAEARDLVLQILPERE